MGEFLTGNEWYWRLARTIAQGIVGVVIAFELGLCTRSLAARAFSLRTCQRARLLDARSVDGLMGPQTVRCLQAWLESHGFDCGPIDGILGPATAKAVQRSLNAGAWS